MHESEEGTKMEKSITMIDELEQNQKVHTVWVGEKDRVASFHAVDSYERQAFSCHDYFMKYLRAMQERGFRFQ